jgi:hypothetical protein
MSRHAKRQPPLPTPSKEFRVGISLTPILDMQTQEVIEEKVIVGGNVPAEEMVMRAYVLAKGLLVQIEEIMEQDIRTRQMLAEYQEKQKSGVYDDVVETGVAGISIRDLRVN